MKNKTKQKFGIRKFSVGVGSIIIGSVIFTGVGHSAHAAELSHSTNQPQVTQEQKDNTTEQQQNNERAAQEQKDNATEQQQNNERAAQEQKDNATEQQQNNERAVQKNENAKSQSTRSSESNTPNTPATRDVLSDNVRSNGGGGADVTPGCAKIQKDGTVKYDYTVSVNPVKSSDHGQTGSTFGITVPKFAKNVKFELIGTREKDSKKPHDVNLDLGQISEEEYKKILSNSITSQRMKSIKN